MIIFIIISKCVFLISENVWVFFHLFWKLTWFWNCRSFRWQGSGCPPRPGSPCRIQTPWSSWSRRRWQSSRSRGRTRCWNAVKSLSVARGSSSTVNSVLLLYFHAPGDDTGAVVQVAGVRQGGQRPHRVVTGEFWQTLHEVVQLVQVPAVLWTHCETINHDAGEHCDNNLGILF